MADQDQGITAYHGSPYKFDRFDLSKIGTGEGAQAYGHGLYFAEAEPVAKEYRDKLTSGTYKTSEGNIFDPSDLEHMNLRVSGRRGIDEALSKANELMLSQPQNAEMIQRDIAKLTEAQERAAAPHAGHMYEVHIDAHPDHFLDWDKPLSEQSEHVRNVMSPRLEKFRKLGANFNHDPSGAELYRAAHPTVQLDDDIDWNKGLAEQASKFLHDNGIHGIKYLDAGSRGNTDNPTRNYVVFDDKRVKVNRRYARGGMVSGYAHGGVVGRHGYSVDGGVPEAGATGSATERNTSENFGSSGSGGIGSDSVADRSGNNGGSGNGSDARFGGGSGNAGQDYLGNMMRQSSPFGGAEIMSPFAGTQMGIPSQSQQHMLDQLGVSGSPYVGGLPKSAALGSNIGSDMLKQSMSSGFDLSGIAKQPGFGDAPNLPGSDFGKSQTIGGSLGAAQTEAMRSGSGWSSEYDPKGISKGVEMGAQMATPSSGMFGQPPMGTTTFGQGVRQPGFNTDTGVQDPSQAAYAEQMAKTARQSWLDANFPQNPRLGDLPTPTPAANPAVPDRSGSMGSMPVGMNKYGSDLTQMSSQPNRPISQTPFSGYPQDVQNALNPRKPDSAFGQTLVDPTGKYTGQALQNMNMATDATTMLNDPGLMGGLVRMFTPTPTPATPQQQAAIEQMYRGAYGDNSVPANFATLAPTPSLPHPGQTADAYLSAGPSASTGRQDMPISRPSVVGSGSPVDAYDRDATPRGSFNQAFAEARSSGQDTFTWTNPVTGRTSLYTTQLARKEGGRVPSMANPDDWIAPSKPKQSNKKKIIKSGSDRNESAIVSRALMLSSRKS